MYSLTILTYEKTVFQGEIKSLFAPGTLGYLEILKDHAAIITSLQAGKLILTDADNVQLIYAISGGILEIKNNQATLLADSMETIEEIDFSRAKIAYERAFKRLDEETDQTDLHRANQALLRAENRMKIYRGYQEAKKHIR